MCDFLCNSQPYRVIKSLPPDRKHSDIYASLRDLIFLSKPVKHGGVDNNSTKNWFALNLEKMYAELYGFTACQRVLIILIVSYRLLLTSSASITFTIAHVRLII